jgi:hypothetical protein
MNILNDLKQELASRQLGNEDIARLPEIIAYIEKLEGVVRAAKHFVDPKTQVLQVCSLCL